MKSVSYLTLLMLLPLVGNAQPEWEWIETLEEFPRSSCMEVIAIGDDVAAFGVGLNENGNHLLCVYYEADGTLVSFEAIPQAGYIEQIIRAGDGGFIIKFENTLRKLSFDFEAEWFREYREDHNARLLDITKCEGGYAMAGLITLDNGQQSNGWFLKIDEEGQIIEENTFFDYLGEGDDEARTELFSIAIHPDGGFIVGYGDLWVNDWFGYHMSLLHLDEAGDSLDLITETRFIKIYPTDQEIYLSSHVGATKVSYNGESIEEANYFREGNIAHSVEGMKLSRGGGGAICGFTTGLDDYDELIFPDVYIIRFDDQLDEKWRLYYLPGRNGECFTNSIAQAENGSYYVGAQIRGEEISGFHLFKTEVDPAYVDSNVNPRLPRSLILYPAYPNPFNNRTYVNFRTDHFSNITATIFDLEGRIIDQQLAYYTLGNHKMTINSDNLNTGTFLIQLSNDHDMQTRKILKLK